MRHIIVALALLLSGCATQAQRQFQAMKSGNETNVTQIKECATAIYNSADYASLRTHIPPSISEATLQQLSDTALPTAHEIHAIMVTHPQFQQCRKTYLINLTHIEPSLVPIITASYNKNDDDLLALTQRRLNWGEFVRRVRDHAVQTQEVVQAEDHRVVGELKEEHQAEMAQRQRAAEALAAWAQTQELINAANRPVITNCNGFGNTVNCVSR